MIKFNRINLNNETFETKLSYCTVISTKVTIKKSTFILYLLPFSFSPFSGFRRERPIMKINKSRRVILMPWCNLMYVYFKVIMQERNRVLRAVTKMVWHTQKNMHVIQYQQKTSKWKKSWQKGNLQPGRFKDDFVSSFLSRHSIYYIFCSFI